jgi:hypothetical protein
MLFHYTPGARQPRPTLARSRFAPLGGRVRALAPVASLAILAGLASPSLAAAQINPCKPIHDPSITTPPDKNAQMEMQQQQASQQQQNYAAANAERKKQISNDSAQLLKLATELKNEVDKTTKDTLSLNVIRKADEIERLAHSVKEKMKLTAGGS